MPQNPLAKHFYFGEKQNGSHYRTYCKYCVDHQENELRKASSWELDYTGTDAAARLTIEEKIRKDAFQAVGSTRGEKSVWIAHLLGGKGIVKCTLASEEARAEAQKQKDTGKKGEEKESTEPTSSKRQHSGSGTGQIDAPSEPKQKKLRVYRGVDCPFTAEQKAAIQAQAERAIISTNLSFRLFEDPEMQTLFGMLRTEAPKILPTRKVVGGRLLNEAAAAAEAKIAKVMNGKEIGMTCI